jgi:signal transduction histidine kinase
LGIYLVSPIKDNNGKITHLLVTQEDVTEKKKNLEELILAKEKAEEANRVKNVFLANMSHELRTPLIGILGYSEMLANELIQPEKLEMAKGIIRSGNRLLNTLNLILDLTRIESDRFEINLKIVNLIDEIYYTLTHSKAPQAKNT